MEEARLIETIKQIGLVNQNKLNTVIQNRFLIQEIDVVLKLFKGLDYYKYIYTYITLDKNNINNSYVMWVLDKVDNINKDKSTNIIKGISSLPDIDSDFPAEVRDRIIQYIVDKYGDDNVAGILTFQNLKGRAALKEVLRIHDVCSFEEMNLITKNLPEEHKISDELQKMKEAGEEPSIILWALKHTPDDFKQWCWLDDNGELQGEYAQYFKQAIRLESIKKAPSRHPAGYVISSLPLYKAAPLVKDTHTNELIIGLEKDDCEDAGLVKFDILVLSILDKIGATQNDVRKNFLDYV